MIASFKHAKQRFSQLDQSLCHEKVSIGSDGESTEIVLARGVKSTGNKNELWVEFLEDGMDDAVIEIDILIIARRLIVVAFLLLINSIQRNVNLRAFSLFKAAIKIISGGSAWVVSSAIVPVNRDEEDIFVFIEDVVGAVSLVHVIIEDGDALDVMPLLEVACAECHIVEHAKTVDFVLGSRVVSRRTNHAESVCPFSVHHFIYSL